MAVSPGGLGSALGGLAADLFGGGRYRKPRPVRGERKGDMPSAAERGAALRAYLNGLIRGGKPAQIRKAQQLLRAQGYDVAVDGKLGPETSSARDAFSRGMSPSAWKDWYSRYAERQDAVRAARPAPGAVAASAPAAPKPSKAAKAQTKPRAASQATGLAGLLANLGLPIPEEWASKGASPFSDAMADEIAGLEYDSMLAGLERALADNEAQTRQNVHDVNTWFGQVLGHQAKAAERDRAMNVAGQESMEEASKRILSSIGGSANEGAGVVGAAGVEAVGALKSLGQAQEEFNEDIRPLLELEKSGEAAKQLSLGADRNAEIAAAIADARREKGQRKSTALFDIQRLNNEIEQGRIDRLIQIRQANNALGQQGFQNQLALSELDLAAAGLDVDVAQLGLSQAKAVQDAQMEAAKLAQGQQKINLAAQKEANRQGWKGLSQKDRQALTAGIVQAVRWPNGQWKLPLNRSWERILGLVRAQGLNPFEPEGRVFLAGVAQALGIQLGPKGNPVGRVQTRR